ncbi:hypothetical protein CRG98_029210 [Punica granatum]|uniref:Uncharacterized protein n=1 Tax=Punica granatum TaxID=22663 RepID=A0A2I0J2C6_PUNGR|nr:hypothetical protein CRG98_029210 [Punica granatum]
MEMQESRVTRLSRERARLERKLGAAVGGRAWWPRLLRDPYARLKAARRVGRRLRENRVIYRQIVAGFSLGKWLDRIGRILEILMSSRGFESLGEEKEKKRVANGGRPWFGATGPTGMLEVSGKLRSRSVEHSSFVNRMDDVLPMSARKGFQ